MRKDRPGIGRPRQALDRHPSVGNRLVVFPLEKLDRAAETETRAVVGLRCAASLQMGFRLLKRREWIG